MSAQVSFDFELTSEVCWSCGIAFAMPRRWARKRGEDGKVFHCPAGCRLSYGESELDKAKKETERLRMQKEWAETRAASNYKLYESETRRLNAVRGHATRLKNRIKNGVCPCCNRSFSNVKRHMASKHPDFKAESE